jgi:lipid II:glycine glycyltransferase (peptidoglycan interpeptide bridge formation enzyme)
MTGEADSSARQQLEAEFTCWCMREDYTRINIIEFTSEVNTHLDLYKARPLYTHLLNICRSGEDQLKRMAPSHRRNIPKAIDSGMHMCEVGTPGDLEDYYRLLEETARRQNRVPFYRLDFYRALQEVFKGSGKLYWPKVVLQEQMVASAIVFIHRNSAIYWDGATSAEGLSSGANYFLFYELISYLREKKISILNFGSSPQQRPGLKRFKSGWGAERMSYFEYDYQKPISRLAGKIKGFFR